MNQNPQKKSFFSWIPCFCYIYIAFFSSITICLPSFMANEADEGFTHFTLIING